MLPTACHLFSTKLAARWCQLGTGLVSSRYQAGIKLVPSWYQVGTKPVPSWYQAGTKLVPSRHQAGTIWIPLGMKMMICIQKIVLIEQATISCKRGEGNLHFDPNFAKEHERDTLARNPDSFTGCLTRPPEPHQINMFGGYGQQTVMT